MNYHVFTRWVTSEHATAGVVQMGVLPANAFVLNPYLIVETAFNAAGNDFIRVGTSTDDDAFGTDHNVASIIVNPANFVAGVALGLYRSGTKIQAKYTYTSTAPTAGKALIILPYLLVPPK